MADIILILVIALFMMWGAKRGLIRTLVGAASTLVSLVLSMVLYKPVSQALYNSSFGDSVRDYVRQVLMDKMGEGTQILVTDATLEAASMLIMNIVSFVAVIIIVKLVVMVIASIANITAKLPVLKQANSLLGMAAGAISGALVCYIVIGVIAALGANESLSDVAQSIEKSYFAASMYNENLVADILSGFIK